MRPTFLLIAFSIAGRPGTGKVERIEGDAEAFASDFTDAFCTQQQACHPNTWLVSLGVEGCRDALDAFEAVDTVAYDPRSATSCSLDAISAQRCLEALDAHACDDSVSLVALPAACESAFFDCAFPIPPE